MIISNRLLRQISDPSLTKEKRAQLRCQLAKELEEVGNFEAAREAMGELWSRVGERPVLDGLDELTAAEVLLRAGVLTGWIGSTKQIEGAQETAKNFITESIPRFEALQNAEKVAEAQTEVGFCYWRQGSYNEARVWLQEALNRLIPDTSNEVRAVALIRLAIVERSAKRFHEALQIHLDSASFFQNINNEALKGKFHYGFAFVLRNLGTAEKRPDYIDRALIEYAAASYHFERARAHTRYQACVENNLGFLFSTIGKYQEAHEHLDRAQALFTSMKDQVHIAQVDDTRAKVLLAEGRTSEDRGSPKAGQNDRGEGGLIAG